MYQIKLLAISLQLLAASYVVKPICYYNEEPADEIQSYAGHQINITDMCWKVDEILSSAEACPSDAKVYDPQTKLCSNFDPRDLDLTVIPQHLINGEGTRVLQESQAFCNQFSNCHDCAYKASQCNWDTGVNKCASNLDEQSKKQRWFESYQVCTDYLGVCNDTSARGITKYKMKPVNGLIPRNYFCHFQHEFTDLGAYKVDIMRFSTGRYSQNREVIDLEVTMTQEKDGKVQSRTDVVEDRAISRNSQYSRMFGTTKASIIFKNTGTIKLDFFVRNLGSSRYSNFDIGIVKINFKNNGYMGNSRYANGQSYQNVLVSLIFMIIFCACFIKICRCVVHSFCRRVRRGRGRGASTWMHNQARNEPNPDRDVGGDSAIQMNRPGRVASRKVKKQQLMNCLDHITYSKETAAQDNFDIRECVICMDAFENECKILRIPTCKHFFHHDCGKKWFDKTFMSNEMRCPCCNEILILDKLKEQQSSIQNRQNPLANSSHDQSTHSRSRNQIAPVPLCFQDHAMAFRFTNPYSDIGEVQCDRCERILEPQDGFFHCGECETDFCHGCSNQN